MLNQSSIHPQAVEEFPEVLRNGLRVGSRKSSGLAKQNPKKSDFTRAIGFSGYI